MQICIRGHPRVRIPRWNEFIIVRVTTKALLSQTSKCSSGSIKLDAKYFGLSTQSSERLEYSRTPLRPPLDLTPLHPFPQNDLSSTQPAALAHTPKPRPESANGPIPLRVRGRYLFNVGRAYLNFYKTGVKKVWSNYKEVRGWSWPKNILEGIRYAETGNPLDILVRHPGHLVQHLEPNVVRGKSWLQKANPKIPLITRREYQLYLRNHNDLRKLIPFGLIFAICGEFTPLVIVLFGSSVVPGPCRIPKQSVADQDRPFLPRTQEHIKWGWKKVEDLELSQKTPWYVPWSLEKEIEWRAVQSDAYAVGATSLWTHIPLLGRVIYKYWTLSKWTRWKNEVFNDMILVRREGGYARLTSLEVFECALKYHTLSALRLIEDERRKTGSLPPLTKDLKRRLVLLLEDHANVELSKDYARLRIDTQVTVSTSLP